MSVCVSERLNDGEEGRKRGVIVSLVFEDPR